MVSKQFDVSRAVNGQDHVSCILANNVCRDASNSQKSDFLNQLVKLAIRCLHLYDLRMRSVWAMYWSLDCIVSVSNTFIAIWTHHSEQSHGLLSLRLDVRSQHGWHVLTTQTTIRSSLVTPLSYNTPRSTGSTWYWKTSRNPRAAYNWISYRFLRVKWRTFTEKRTIL